MIKILENFKDYLRPGSNPHECKIKLDNGSYKMLKMKRVILGGNKIAELGAQQFVFLQLIYYCVLKSRWELCVI